MKKRVIAISIFLVVVASFVFAGSNGLSSYAPQEQKKAEPAKSSTTSTAQKKRDYVDMKSDEGWQMEHNGRKIMVVVGHFAAYHNGTVITADSAVRYNERHIECFGNVLIKRGTTYIYGDRAEYNGRTSRAKVYSKIIKVVDGDATLLTYNFEFNTRTNIGRYTGGGVLISGDNMLESNRGYVYSDKHEIICVDKVQMRNSEYDMMSDSVVYNTDTNYAQFFTHTNIWNKDKNKPNEEGDYLYADRGTFDKDKQIYTLTRNGYILTKNQELLCDTLYYYRDSDYVRLQRNIQIDDREQKMLVFGDWGEYWREPGNVFMTKNPSLISYDLSQSDSVYISSDSMYIYTRYPVREKIEKARKDSLAQLAKKVSDEKKSSKSEAKPNAEDKKENKEAMAKRKEQEERAKMAAAKKAKGKNSDAAGGPEATPPTGGRKPGVGQPPLEGKPSPSAAKGEPKAQEPKADGANVAEVKDSTAVAVMSPSEIRRMKIDSLANDTTKYGMQLRAKLIKEEAAEVNRAAKAAIRAKHEARKAELAERNTLFKRLLGEAKVRDAERARKEKERAQFVKDSIKQAQSVATDSLAKDSVKRDTLRRDVAKIDTLKRDSSKVDSVKVDSLAQPIDTLAKFDTMTVAQVKAYFKAINDAEKAEAKRIKQDSLDAKLERIGLARQAKRAEQYKKWAIRDSIYLAKMKEREYENLRRKLARQQRRGIFVKMADSATLALVDSILVSESRLLDSIACRGLDSLLEVLYPKPQQSPTEVAKKEVENIDSLYREIRAFSHVKMYRSDFQTICDSLTTNSVDSIINLYKSPIMWNGGSQISSDVTRIITQNSKLVRAEFEGKPLTASEIDTAHYNQVAGKEMVAYFRDNKIYRNDVKGNVQTIYFMQEEGSTEITLMAYIEAGDMTSYIEDQQVVGITYRGNPTYIFYPIDKIPETQALKLPGFKWEANRRPTQDSIFNRTIRPSQREAKRALSKPMFPIHQLMQQRKVDYLRRREWRDRKDTLTYETIEWIESLKAN